MAEQAKISEIGLPGQFASHSRLFRLMAENRNCSIACAPCAKDSGGYDG